MPHNDYYYYYCNLTTAGNTQDLKWTTVYSTSFIKAMEKEIALILKQEEERKQREKDKKRYPLFFLKDGIV